jgi:glutathione S-transferase
VGVGEIDLRHWFGRLGHDPNGGLGWSIYSHLDGSRQPAPADEIGPITLGLFAASLNFRRKSQSETAMLTVHHLGISQSDRIVWLCEELAIPYALVRYDRDPVTRMAPAAYKALHPFGTAPVITDGDVVLGESGAIIDYVIARHGGGRLSVAASEPNFPDYLYWFHFAEMVEMVVSSLGGDGDGTMVKFARERRERAYAMLEQRLGTVPYLAGAGFTAADIITLFPLTTMRLFVPRDLSPFPNIRAYLQRIGARPAFQRAMKKADPDLLPNLT